MKIGVYAGSFNPFHGGHQNILRKASNLFDKIYVVAMINSEKENVNSYWTGSTLNKYINNCEIEYSTVRNVLLVDFCRYNKATHIIRGIRNNKDFNYEQELYGYNKIIDNSIETIYFMSDKEFENISSSFIRELQKYGKDVSEYLV